MSLKSKSLKPHQPLPDIRRERFCVLYVTEFPALTLSEIAQKAGFSPKNPRSAGTQASRLLSAVEVGARIRWLANEAAKHAIMDKGERLKRLSMIARGQVSQRIHGTDRGQPTDLVNEPGPEVQISAMRELAALEGAYPEKRGGLDLMAILADAGGLRVTIDMQGRLPDRTKLIEADAAQVQANKQEPKGKG